MKLTYEIQTVFKSLFNQVAVNIDDSKEAYSHVELKFNEKLDPVVFYRYFNPQSGCTLIDNSLLIAKESILRFKNIIKNHFKVLEMELNHKKCGAVLTPLLDNKTKSISQISPDSALLVRFQDEINETLFNKHFMMDKSNFDLSGDELTIFPDGITDFNKAIDFLYVEFTQKFLTKRDEKAFSPKLF